MNRSRKQAASWRDAEAEQAQISNPYFTDYMITDKIRMDTVDHPRQDEGGILDIGCGDFDLIVYSYEANSDSSLSSTRKKPYGIISESQAMGEVDANGGYYRPLRVWEKST